MSFVVGSIYVATTGTALRGVTRVNLKDCKSVRLGFVADKFLHLVERPSVHIPALRFTHLPGTVTNAIQLFNGYGGVSGFSRKTDNTLADLVIRVSLKAPLPTRQPFQNAPDRPGVPLCLFLLERSAGVAVMAMPMFGVSTAKKLLACAIGDHRN